MITEQLARQRVLPVLRLPSGAAAIEAAFAMFDVGLELVELTATTPGWESALRETVRANPKAGVGLGTVTDAEIADRAIQAGARFLVSPWPVPVARAIANAAGVLFIEGAFTPAEVAAGVKKGPTKVFPAHVGGPAYLRSLLAVLPGAVLIPTGGIALTDVGEWLQAGATAVGIGSDLLRPGAADLLREALAKTEAHSVQKQKDDEDSGDDVKKQMDAENPHDDVHDSNPPAKPGPA
jgi:2-dehydro-3-deoxyphosphogluconate aldolase/(4S)-4-hydroxy-2-oxoglutarate aldolase